MKKKNGYAIQELIILCAIIGIIFGYSITKISFAYQEASEKENLLEEENNAIKLATEVYIKSHEEEFTKTEETFLFGKDLTDAGYLIQTKDFDYSKTKIKVTYNKETKKYTIEIMN